MENTVAFSYLMDLIEVLHNLFSSPFLFGFSIIGLIILSFLFSAVIGLLTGGLAPRSKSPSDVAYQKSDTKKPVTKAVKN